MIESDCLAKRRGECSQSCGKGSSCSFRYSYKLIMEKVSFFLADKECGIFEMVLLLDFTEFVSK